MSYDLYFSAVSQDGKTLGFNTKAAQAVTGLTKVAVRFVKHLLTPVGSEVSDYAIGTALADLPGGNIGDDAYANAVARLSVNQAAEQLIKTQVGRPDEPQLEKVNILAVTFAAGRLDISVELVMADGTVASLVLPTISTSENNVLRGL